MAGAKASYCHLVQMVRMFVKLWFVGSAILQGAELLESDCKSDDTAHRTCLGNFMDFCHQEVLEGCWVIWLLAEHRSFCVAGR
jgi:hypothetical protein